MTNFVLLYTGGTYPESEEEQAAVMGDWGAWYGQMGESIVDGGNPFSGSRSVGEGGAVNDSGVASPEITGYTVISADSFDEAMDKVKNHPHVKHGGQVSVYETFQM